MLKESLVQVEVPMGEVYKFIGFELMMLGLGGLLASLISLQIFFRRSSIQVNRSQKRDTKTWSLIVAAGLEKYLTPLRFLFLKIFTTILLFFVASHVLGIVISGGIALVGFFLPGMLLSTLAARRQKKYARDLVFLLRYMVTLLTSGNNLGHSIDLLAGRYAPDTYRPAMSMLANDMRNFTLREAMLRAQTNIGNAIFDRMVGYFLVNSELGAELLPLLKDAQRQIELNDKLTNEIVAATSQTKLGAYFVPIALGGLVLGEQLLGGSTGYWAPYYTIIGQVIEMFLFGLFGVGFLIMKNLLAIPPADRINYYGGRQ